MKRLQLFVFAAVLFWGAGLQKVWAEPSSINGQYIERLDVFFDAPGQLDASDIEEQNWQPLKGMLTGGFKQGAHWLRIRVVAHAEPLVLRTRPAFVDSVEIFALNPSLDAAKAEGPDAGLADGRTMTLTPLARLGDQHLDTQIFSTTKLNGLFEISPSDQAQTFYLRLTSVSSHLLFVEVQTLSEAASFEQNQHLVLGLYLGFLLTFAIWALAQLYLGYDRVIAAFLVKQIADLAYVSGFTGLMGMWLTRAGLGHWADLAFSLSILVVVAAGSFFHASLLGEFRPYKWAIRILWSGIFVLPLGLVLYAVGWLQLALIMNTVIANLFPLVSLICALSAGAYRPNEKSALPPSISKFQLVLTYTIFAVSLQVATLPALGLWADRKSVV
jgi:hypothetical protein